MMVSGDTGFSPVLFALRIELTRERALCHPRFGATT
jgi:hypothetical protein